MNDSRERILSKSLNLFIEKGFKEVTMQEIVQKTGLSKGAFYHYFNSKEQVFEEVINHYYTELITPNYYAFSKKSLKDFCADFLKEKKNRVDASKIKNSNKEKAITLHHYFLMFDAIKMLPAFKKLREELQKKELAIWTNIIAVAKKNKEIKSTSSNKDIAKLFIYASKGIGIHCIINKTHNDIRKEIKTAWSNLYSMLSNK
ncbi:MAG: TetR/AcrR family transcriptional regulator [Bacteroidetes bacterium]|nr:TetR/AcrR family transcriptional regulator [Bacteroidota bacterium]